MMNNYRIAEFAKRIDRSVPEHKLASPKESLE
jgi:hypothetical protein